jgi:hypothetical protein
LDKNVRFLNERFCRGYQILKGDDYQVMVNNADVVTFEDDINFSQYDWLCGR